jgi:predicted lipoprotein with Yx(FWY)xxD motif
VRDDGSRQWAYKGKPLYGYVADVTPGQASGDGVNGRWHVARISP